MEDDFEFVRETDRRIRRGCYVLLGVALVMVVAVLLCRARAAPSPPRPSANAALPGTLPSPLERLSARIKRDPNAPAWKRQLLPRIRERRIGRFQAVLTCYAPGRPDIDPPCGGRYGATGVRLRWGHVAVDPRVIPLRSVLLIEGVDQVMLAVDTGGAVRGRHIDIACPEADLYFAMARRFSHTKARVWLLGRVTKAEAR